MANVVSLNNAQSVFVRTYWELNDGRHYEFQIFLNGLRFKFDVSEPELFEMIFNFADVEVEAGVNRPIEPVLLKKPDPELEALLDEEEAIARRPFLQNSMDR